MTQTIDALWNGDLAFCEHCGAYDAEANRLVGEMTKCQERLWEELPEVKRQQAQEYIDRMERYTLRMMELAFRDGFTTGMRLTAEGIYAR